MGPEEDHWYQLQCIDGDHIFPLQCSGDGGHLPNTNHLGVNNPCISLGMHMWGVLVRGVWRWHFVKEVFNCVASRSLLEYQYSTTLVLLQGKDEVCYP